MTPATADNFWVPEFACMIHRLEVYADLGNEKKHKFVSLESLGVEVQ